MKKSLVILCEVLLVFGVVGMSVVATLVTASNAMAATFELRDCFESPPLSEQSANNLWTFHRQDHNGSMLPLAYEPTGYGNPSEWELIGPVILSGDLAWVSFTISSNEILEALTDPLNQIVSSVKIALEQTPPELGADIAERGVVLTGGGALLRDIDRLLMEETGLPVIIAEDPLTCVVRGSGKALEKMDNLVTIFASD